MTFNLKKSIILQESVYIGLHSRRGSLGYRATDIKKQTVLFSRQNSSCPTKGCDCLSLSKDRYDETFAGEDGQNYVGGIRYNSLHSV